MTPFTKPTVAELAEEVSGHAPRVPVLPNLIPGLDSIDPDEMGSGHVEVVL